LGNAILFFFPLHQKQKGTKERKPKRNRVAKNCVCFINQPKCIGYVGIVAFGSFPPPLFKTMEIVSIFGKYLKLSEF